MAASINALNKFLIRRRRTLSVYFRRDSSTGSPTTNRLLRLKDRGFFQNIFPRNSETEFAEVLDRSFESSPISAYCGFDPTSDSLHIGHLLPIMALIHCQRSGHNSIALIGGATVSVGDPSGHDGDRARLSNDVISHNESCINNTLRTIFTNHDTCLTHSCDQQSLKRIQILNNREWYSSINLVDFLASMGRHFRMGPMLNRHSVKSRLHSDEGMSFSEFSYQIFQAYDWLHLYRRYNCLLQFGGNDQMGNITSGHELISRVCHAPVYSLTVPLITTATGVKLGKSAGNAVWLDPAKTTAFDLYQYFINIADSDVEKYLSLFTFLSDEEIRDLMHKQKLNPEDRVAQKKLAEQVTLLVHGDEGVKMALRWTAALISRDVQGLRNLSQSDLPLLFKSIPCADLMKEAALTVLALCMNAGCFTREVDGERVIKEGGVRINHERVWDPQLVVAPQHILPTDITLIQIGKKSTFHVIRWH